MRPTFQVIPAIDLIDGQVVRLTQGNYNQVTHYPNNPVEVAKSFEDDGATRLHLVDLNGAKEGSTVNLSTIEAIRAATSMAIEVGGGIRTQASIDRYLDMGINQVILGSLLVNNPDLSTELIQAYPHQIIAGLDTKDGFIAVEGWTETSSLTLTDFLQTLSDLPIHSIIFTKITYARKLCTLGGSIRNHDLWFDDCTLLFNTNECVFLGFWW